MAMVINRYRGVFPANHQRRLRNAVRHEPPVPLPTLPASQADAAQVLEPVFPKPGDQRVLVGPSHGFGAVRRLQSHRDRLRAIQGVRAVQDLQHLDGERAGTSLWTTWTTWP